MSGQQMEWEDMYDDTDRCHYVPDPTERRAQDRQVKKSRNGPSTITLAALHTHTCPSLPRSQHHSIVVLSPDESFSPSNTLHQTPVARLSALKTLSSSRTRCAGATSQGVSDQPLALGKLKSHPSPVHVQGASVARRFRCRYCWEFVDCDDEAQCSAAPSRWQRVRETVSCAECARAVVYHSCKDSNEEGELADRLFSCTRIAEESRGNFCCRWTCLAGLAFSVLPCLLCYFPLRFAERCSRQCVCCRTRHARVTRDDILVYFSDG